MELLKKSQHKANIQISHTPEWAIHPISEEIKEYKNLMYIYWSINMYMLAIVYNHTAPK
jgi:hypothetical protein